MIKNKSMDARQYPRCGKLKIGEPKGQNSPGRSIDYFRPTGRYAAMFTKILGDKPNEIEIVFPPAPNGDINQIINHFYRSYKGSKLYCIGDGETANRSDGKGNMEPRECPCDFLNNEKKQCSERLKLVFMIPKIPIVGVWEFETGSTHTRINAFSGIDITRAFAGNVAGIPMTMRVEFQTGAVSGSQNKFPVVTIVPNASTEQLLQLSGADVNTRLNVMMLGKAMPEIEQLPEIKIDEMEPKKLAELPEKRFVPNEKQKKIMTELNQKPALKEEPEAEDININDLSEGELNTAIVDQLKDESPMVRRELKIEHLGHESISDCDDKQKKAEFLKFLQAYIKKES